MPPSPDAGLTKDAVRPAGAGGAVPSVGGAMGGRGGGGGGMPTGGAPNQGQNKDGKGGKRYGDEEDIYTEDRAWTSSVIGVRKRNDLPE
jgi:hypothetical protein